MTIEEWLNNDFLALSIWHNKYQYNDESFDQWLDRVSNHNIDIKKLIIEKKFIFGGRILANRGVKDRKVTYSNCYVLPRPDDNLESIFNTAADMARTFSYGGGVGIDLSNLRPKGAETHNAAKVSSGPVSFMDLYSQVTQTISQNGRRGATMISLDVRHPDIEEFIDCKTDLSKVNYANISVRVNDSFMKAVENNEDYILSWPCSGVDFNYEIDAPYNKLQSTTSIQGTPVYYKRVEAKKLFNKLAKNNWQYAEPGILYWNRISEYNLLEGTGIEYAGVNPCAEEPLLAGGSCLLGSINLAEFVEIDSDGNSQINLTELSRVTSLAVCALNDVLFEGLSLHPLEIQQNTVSDYRQIGLGTCGLADMLIKLNIEYGSPASLEIIDFVYKTIATTALSTSCDLVQTYGSYTNCNSDILLNTSFIKSLKLPETLIYSIKKQGIVNSQLLTCAPTGSVATMLGVSTGIEPIYAMEYTRTTKSLEAKDKIFKVYTPIVEKWLKEHPGHILPSYFVASKDIKPINRIKVQSTVQKYIDASISSTINLPTTTTIEEVANIYMLAWKYGLKGVTVYRAGCAREGILNTEKTTISNEENQCFNCITPISRKTMGTTFGQTSCKKCACGTLYVTANKDSKGNFVELFTHTSKGGICQANLNAVTRGISLALRSGVKIDEVIDQLKGIHCPACSLARAKGQQIDGASCPDIISKVMQEFILNTDTSTEIVSGDHCPECGAPLNHEGGCVTCTSCGYSKCN